MHKDGSHAPSWLEDQLEMGEGFLIGISPCLLIMIARSQEMSKCDKMKELTPN